MILRFDERVLRSAISSKLAYSPNICRFVTPALLSRYMWPTTRAYLMIPTERTNFRCIDDTTQIDKDGRCGSPRAFMWRSGPGEMVVAFRGTAGLHDVVDTLDSRTAPFAFCGTNVRVHAGMLGAFSEMEGELTASIVDEGCIRSVTSITFTGHSKGGSHAQFAAAYYSSMLAGRCRIACHTFGAPRIGDRAFAEWYAASVEDSVIVVDRDDMVVNMPPVCVGYDAAGLVGTVVLESLRKSWNPLVNHNMDSYLEHTLAMLQRTANATRDGSPLGYSKRDAMT